MYNPPSITHIDQILPLIAKKEEFIVKHKEGYTVIDYVYEQPETFTDPLLIECRGIKFHSDGRILARPFNKFFNLNQHASTKFEDVQWDKNHIIMEKLDGSMVHPAWLDDDTMLLMTRMGNTDVAQKAEKFITKELELFCKTCHREGITPIFEYVAPDNRIVIRYEKSELVLLAARYIDTGQYVSRRALESYAKHFGVPIVQVYEFNTNTNATQFVEQARAIEGMEGYVIHFQGNEIYNNFLMKLKGDDYVLKHRTKSYFDHEKNILQVILDDKTDDIIPLLDPTQKATLIEYADCVNRNIHIHATAIKEAVEIGIPMVRKDFALGVAQTIRPAHRGLMFSCVDKKVTDIIEITKLLKESYKKHYNSQTKVDENREIIGMFWHGQPSTGE